MSRTADDLSGRVVVVTGGARGIGAAISRGAAEAGARVAVIGRDRDRLDAFAATLRDDTGADVLAFPADVADETSVDAVFAELVETWGAIDGLVNNAGISKVAPSLDFELDDWRRILETNVTGVFVCARAAARHMIAAERGSIVNIASLSSFVGQPERAAYVSSKAAVLGMTKSLAVEWGPLGVRVNAIAPGYIETDLVADLLQRGVLDRGLVEGRTPLRRFGTPDDLVGAALFLLGDRSAFATGQALSIDGGWLANGYLR